MVRCLAGCEGMRLSNWLDVAAGNRIEAPFTAQGLEVPGFEWVGEWSSKISRGRFTRISKPSSP